MAKKTEKSEPQSPKSKPAAAAKKVSAPKKAAAKTTAPKIAAVKTAKLPKAQSTAAPAILNPVEPYSRFTDFDIALFKSGKHYRLYEKLGSHVVEHNSIVGTYFAVWAPNARYVAVIGNFNGWNRGSHALFVRWDGSGIWEGFIPNVGNGETYKYFISSSTGEDLEKSDMTRSARAWRCSGVSVLTPGWVCVGSVAEEVLIEGSKETSVRVRVGTTSASATYVFG